MEVNAKPDTPGRRVKFLPKPSVAEAPPVVRIGAPAELRSVRFLPKTPLPAVPQNVPPDVPPDVPPEAGPDLFGNPAVPRPRVRFLTPRVAVPTPPRDAFTADAPADPVFHSDTVPEIVYALPDCTSVRATLSGSVCSALRLHCRESLEHGREVGGVLVGYRTVSQTPAGAAYSVQATDLIPMESSSSSGSHVQFDETDWDYVDQQMESLYAAQGKCRVGWYHTHPTQGIFFSQYDRDAHTVFQQPFQFALVVDPQAMEAGLFYWADYRARSLGGPVRFRLSALPPVIASGLASGRADSPGLPVPMVLSICGAALVSMVVAPRWGLRTAGVGALAVTSWLAWKFRRHPLPTWNWEWRGAMALPAAALLIFAIGSRTGEQRALRLGVPAPPVTATAQPATSPTPAPPAVAAPVVPSPPPVAAAPGRSLRLLVQQQRRGRDGRVVLLSPERRLFVNYRVQNCKQPGVRSEFRSCRIQVELKKEQTFLRTVFDVAKTERAAWQPLQKSLGLSGKQVDGLWGRVTRTRFLEAAVAPRQTHSLPVNFPQPGPADLIFMPAGPTGPGAVAR